MKIRLMGTAEEVTQAATALARVLTVVEVSEAYPCRPPSRLVRVYLETRPADPNGGEEQ